MFRKDKPETTNPAKEVKKEPGRIKFEVLYQNWTPYKRPGSWLQFIWRW